jgi:hypothetical protein
MGKKNSRSGKNKTKNLASGYCVKQKKWHNIKSKV